MKSLHACGNRAVVMIPKVAGDSKSTGGIVLPGAAEELMTAVVQSVGAGRSTTEVQPCRRGDTVIMLRDDYPVLFEKDGMKYVIVEFNRILAVKERCTA